MDERQYRHERLSAYSKALDVILPGCEVSYDIQTACNLVSWKGWTRKFVVDWDDNPHRVLKEVAFELLSKQQERDAMKQPGSNNPLAFQPGIGDLAGALGGQHLAGGVPIAAQGGGGFFGQYGSQQQNLQADAVRYARDLQRQQQVHANEEMLRQSQMAAAMPQSAIDITPETDLAWLDRRVREVCVVL